MQFITREGGKEEDGGGEKEKKKKKKLASTNKQTHPSQEKRIGRGGEGGGVFLFQTKKGTKRGEGKKEKAGETVAFQPGSLGGEEMKKKEKKEKPH